MVEDQVIEHYRTVQLRPEFIEWVHGQIDNALQDQAGSRRQLRDQIQGQIARLQTRVDNLIDLVADGGLAGSKAREKITEIERERSGLETRLGTIEDDLSIGAEFLKGWLELLRDPYELYRTASNDMRRDLNQAIFTRIFVIDQDRAESEPQEHVRLLLEAQAEWAASFGLGIEAGSNENDAEASSRGESTEGHWRKPVDLALGSSKQSLVPLEGLEPPTLSLGRNCSSIELQRRCIHSKGGAPAGTLRSYHRGMSTDVVDLKQKLSLFAEPWSPKVVARLNDYEVKVVKLQGEFVWHVHEDTDELFLVVDGSLTIQLRDRDVHLETGQLFVVPRGVEHCPLAHGEVHAVLIEPTGVVNTGDAGGELTATYDDSLL